MLTMTLRNIITRYCNPSLGISWVKIINFIILILKRKWNLLLFIFIFSIFSFGWLLTNFFWLIWLLNEREEKKRSSPFNSEFKSETSAKYYKVPLTSLSTQDTFCLLLVRTKSYFLIQCCFSCNVISQVN